LTRIFREIGEERLAKPIAAEIIKNRPVKKTEELAGIVSRICPGQHEAKSLSRIFMALRVVVNDELSAIDKVLPAALNLLRVGGVMVMLSYDSHEDKRVKEFFSYWSKTCHCPPEIPMCVCNTIPKLKVLTPRIIRPSEKELEFNRRSRSAKLRAAKRI